MLKSLFLGFFLNKRKVSSLGVHFPPSLVTRLDSLKCSFIQERIQLLIKNYLLFAGGLYQLKRVTWWDRFLQWENPSNPQTSAMKAHTTSKRGDDGTKRKQGQILDQSTVKKWLNWCLKDFLTKMAMSNCPLPPSPLSNRHLHPTKTTFV